MNPAPVMRAKMRVAFIEPINETAQVLKLCAVCPSAGYPADGSDENNSYALWTPSANLEMFITNPELVNKFVVGQELYLDFTIVE